MLTMVYGLWFMVDIYRTGGSEKKQTELGIFGYSIDTLGFLAPATH